MAEVIYPSSCDFQVLVFLPYTSISSLLPELFDGWPLDNIFFYLMCVGRNIDRHRHRFRGGHPLSGFPASRQSYSSHALPSEALSA